MVFKWYYVDFRSSKSFLGVPRFSCTKSSKTRKEHITLKTICEHFCRHEINQTSKTLKSQLALKAFCSTAFRTEHIFTKLSNSTKKFCIGFGWDPNFKGTYSFILYILLYINWLMLEFLYTVPSSRSFYRQLSLIIVI